MIRCYDGIFKIGQSANLEQRLLTYQGVYWNSDILHVWNCDN